MNKIQFLDRRYDEDEFTVIDELYQNIEQLWENFTSYYELLVTEESDNNDDETVNRSIRKADYKNSEVKWVVGNLKV
jgi:hypothetical protein